MGQKIAKDTGIDTAAGKVSYFDYIYFIFYVKLIIYSFLFRSPMILQKSLAKEMLTKWVKSP